MIPLCLVAPLLGVVGSRLMDSGEHERLGAVMVECAGRAFALWAMTSGWVRSEGRT